MLLIAIGADGHVTDRLSSLRYTYDGYTAAAHSLGGMARSLGAPVLLGGAGGYQPTTHTPAVWATFVTTLWATRNADEVPPFAVVGREAP